MRPKRRCPTPRDGGTEKLMVLGAERSLLIANPVRRAAARVLGDTHFGRVLRMLYLRQALDRLPFTPRSILDAGCGKGYNLFYLARRYPGARLVGLDLHAADLADAERIRAAAGLHTLSFRRHDIQQPFPGAPYDLVLSWEAMQYLPDDSAMLAHVCDALQPGGLCLLHLMHAVRAYRPGTGADPDRWDAGQVRPGYLEAEITAKLRAAGFTRIRVRPTFGAIGMLAHGIFQRAREWPTPAYAALFPALVALGELDVRAAKRAGGGLLVEAGK